jgi:hypothetical protein
MAGLREVQEEEPPEAMLLPKVRAVAVREVRNQQEVRAERVGARMGARVLQGKEAMVRQMVSLMPVVEGAGTTAAVADQQYQYSARAVVAADHRTLPGPLRIQARHRESTQGMEASLFHQMRGNRRYSQQQHSRD